MSGITPDDSNKLIRSEQKRLQEVELKERIKGNQWCKFVLTDCGVQFEDFYSAMRQAQSFDHFAKLVGKLSKREQAEAHCAQTLYDYDKARRDFNEIRSMLGLKHFRQPRLKEKSQQAVAGDAKKPRA